MCAFRFFKQVDSLADLEGEPDASREHCTLVDGRFHLVDSPERFLNHSCRPNVFERFDEDGACLVALEEIATGEELTTDYLINNEGGESWSCSCGADRCRGETGVSLFTLPVAFRREYAPLLAPWFVRRNRERLRGLEGVPTE